MTERLGISVERVKEKEGVVQFKVLVARGKDVFHSERNPEGSIFTSPRLEEALKKHKVGEKLGSMTLRDGGDILAIWSFDPNGPKKMGVGAGSLLLASNQLLKTHSEHKITVGTSTSDEFDAMWDKIGFGSGLPVKKFREKLLDYVKKHEGCGKR